MSNGETPELSRLQKSVIRCRLCSRLTGYIGEVGKVKTKRYANELYWSKPVATFGDPKARLFIIGLAPAAHGGNRTGRVFTGDSSGEWLLRALYETGFANKPTSISRNDGLILRDAYLTVAVRCAPPSNKPTMSEMANCSQYLSAELKLLEKTTRVVVALGKIAFDAYCNTTNIKGLKFEHNKIFDLKGDKTLIASYHPSRRNTNTRILTWQMWISIFRTAKLVINSVDVDTSRR